MHIANRRLQHVVPLTLSLLLASPCVANAAAGFVGPAPAIFEPGVISGAANDGSPSFMPDGKTLFYTVSGATSGAIMESHLVSGQWTKPAIAPFSGMWNDSHAVVAPDGSFIVFESSRPVPGISERVAHLWRVDHTRDGWGTPVHLPAAVNNGSRIYAPSIAADGTIYFLSIGANRSFQLFRSQFAGGTYQQAEPLSFSSPATADVDPMIAPDQSFLVFSSSGRRTKDDTREHLYIVFQEGGAWGSVMPMRYDGDDDNGSSNDNEPEFSPDRQTLFFSSDRTLRSVFPRTREQAETDLARIESWDNGNTNVWTLPLAPWLKATA